MKHLIIIFLVSITFFLVGVAIFQIPGMDRATGELVLQDNLATTSNLVVEFFPSSSEEPSNSRWAEITGTHLTLSHIFDGDIETVMDVLFNDWLEPEDLSETVSMRVLFEEWEGSKKITRTEWCAYGEIPKIAQNFIKPEMLTWIEEAVWDSKLLIYTWTIKSHYLKDKLTSRGEWTYRTIGENKTERKLDGILQIRMPIFGTIIERMLVKRIYNTFEEEYHIMNQKVRERMSRKNGIP